MRSVWSRARVSASLLVLAACAGESALTPDPAARPDLSVGASASGQYVVLLKQTGSIPLGFTAAVAASGGSITASWPAAGLVAVAGLDPTGAAALAGQTDVSAVEPDDMLALDPVTETDVAAADVVQSPTNPAAAFFFARQWNMRAIQADVAWAAGKLGSPSVTVAILDTGIDYTYPDLAGRVDLARSASFVPSDDALVATFFPGRHPITDLHFHGTHVASTVVSNGNVIAGVTSRVTLIGVKVCNVNGSCATSGVLGGIIYAADQGAHVINMSLGGAFSKAGAQGFHSIINRVMSYAQQRGTLVVVSAGNSAADLDHDGNTYRAYCSAPNVACVAATGPTAAPANDGPFTEPDAPASYTNFGRSAINVAAPGGTGLGTVRRSFVWSACSQTSLVIPICRTGTFILGVNGTSMAAPHASGVAALLVERLGRNPQAIRSSLEQTADDINQPGTDPYSGKGRVNAARAAGL
jgi:subtilisin family serine protease